MVARGSWWWGPIGAARGLCALFSFGQFLWLELRGTSTVVPVWVVLPSMLAAE